MTCGLAGWAGCGKIGGIAGQLADRIGPRPVAITGLVLTAFGTLPFAWAGPATSQFAWAGPATSQFAWAGPATSQWLLAGAPYIRGAGLSGVTIAVIAAYRSPKNLRTRADLRARTRKSGSENTT